MYTPEHFKETDRQVMCDLMRGADFAAVTSHHEGRPSVTHLPILLDEENNRLLGHFARANPHWRSLLADPHECLTVFLGPHNYISPSWYTEPGVPTWNYAAVHVYGKFSIIDDPVAHRAVLRRLTESHEARLPEPCTADFDDDAIAAMVHGTVAFAIAITEMQGKMKLNQNRSSADRAGVIAALKKSGTDDARAIAALMRARQ